MASAQGELLESGTAHFVIEGEALTDLVRALVTEGRWRHALTILKEGLHGISTDEALSVLQGTHKLTGENTVDLVPEDRQDTARAYLTLLAWQYAGLLNRHARGMWQPYAEVVVVGPDDVPRGESAPTLGDLWRMRTWTRKRHLYYADDPKRDDVIDVHGTEGAVLWRPVEDPPLWLRGTDDPEVALADYISLRQRLEPRGYQYFRGQQEPHDTLTEDHQEDRVAPLPSLAASMAQTLGVTGKMADALAAITGEAEERVSSEPDTDLIFDAGYILPNGDFYGCAYMHHRYLAERLLRDLLKVEANDPQLEADKRNWLRIQGSVQGNSTSILSPKGRPTKAQQRTLVDWCIKHGVPYPADF